MDHLSLLLSFWAKRYLKRRYKVNFVWIASNVYEVLTEKWFQTLVYDIQFSECMVLHYLTLKCSYNFDSFAFSDTLFPGYRFVVQIHNFFLDQT